MMLRSAFTILEMLIVLSIMITFMAIGAGAWVNSAERNESVAVQDLVASLIHQARNRSISQGLPIVLHFDDQNNVVTGIDQLYLWNESFDWDISNFASYLDPASDSIPLPTEMSFGRTGYAWKFPWGAPGSGNQVFLKAFNTTPISQIVGSETYQPLFKDPKDGFILRCSVKAPDVRTAQTSQIPLLLISEKGTTDDVADAIAGLELWKVSEFIDDNSVEHKIGQAWAIVGWLKERPTYPDLSGGDSKAIWADFEDGNNFVRDWSADGQLNPYTGNTWIDVAFAYDVATLILFRDGQQVDLNANAVSNVSFTPTLNQEIDIYVGRQTEASQQYVTEAEIDNAALLNIGVGQQHTLPGSLKPSAPYKIVCNNGQVECFDNGSSINDLIFVNQIDEGENFRISVFQNGTIEKHVYTSEELTQ